MKYKRMDTLQIASPNFVPRAFSCDPRKEVESMRANDFGFYPWYCRVRFVMGLRNKLCLTSTRTQTAIAISE